MNGFTSSSSIFALPQSLTQNPSSTPSLFGSYPSPAIYTHTQTQTQTQTQRTNPINLKLIIDKNTKQLLFAEANKDFVDFLFNIMSLPLGSLLSLFKTEEQNPIVAENSLGTLYESIKNMDNSNFDKINKKTTLLGCITSSNSLEHAAYVQASKYMVMDDLTVEPMSMISSLKRLNEMGDYGSDVNKLEEKEVRVGKTEAVRLLKESFMTKKVLSTVFLGEKYKENEDAKESQEDYVVVGGQGHGVNNVLNQTNQRTDIGHRFFPVGASHQYF